MKTLNITFIFFVYFGALICSTKAVAQNHTEFVSDSLPSQGKHANISATMLVCLGAAFTESVPIVKTQSDFKVFPVYEPAINAELLLNRLMKLNAGITYRFISGANVPYMANKQLCGPSVYIALLFRTCTCDL